MVLCLCHHEWQITQLIENGSICLAPWGNSFYRFVVQYESSPIGALHSACVTAGFLWDLLYLRVTLVNLPSNVNVGRSALNSNWAQ